MLNRISTFLAHRGRAVRDWLGLRRRIDRAAVVQKSPDCPSLGAGLHGVAALKPGISAEIFGFGANPGALKMHLYQPARAPAAKAPLIVVLHGCGQDFGTFATESGWTALADRLAIPLVLPEQTAGNNPGRCFNWFRPGDTARSGEVLSIREMVAAATAYFESDPECVFIVGLSAGAAMANAAMAAYPDVFAAGASVAGLPVGGANGVTSALARMAGRGPALSADAWAAGARALAPSYAGRWPRLSIWQGTADRTVAPGNATDLAAQWIALLGADAAAAEDFSVTSDLRREVWSVGGRAVLESWTIAGMAHGFPISGPPGKDSFVLPVGIDAVAAIARFWNLPGLAADDARPQVAIMT